MGKSHLRVTPAVVFCFEVDKESVSIVFEGVEVAIQPIDSSIGLIYGTCYFMTNMPNYVGPRLIECRLDAFGFGD